MESKNNCHGNTKNQVEIPQIIKDRYAIRPHDKINFIIEKDGLILKPVGGLRDLRGSVNGSGDLETKRLAAKEDVGQRLIIKYHGPIFSIPISSYATSPTTILPKQTELKGICIELLKAK